jgi:hypothetical protein
MYVRLAQLASVAVFVLGPVLSRACADCACVEAPPDVASEFCACCSTHGVDTALTHGHVSCCATGVECPTCWWCAARGATTATVASAGRTIALLGGPPPVHEEPLVATAVAVRPWKSEVLCHAPDLWGSALPLLI